MKVLVGCELLAGWIKPEDQLPNEGDLLALFYPKWKFPITGYFDAFHGWKDYDGETLPGPPTHYIKMPSPPSA
jgi:hypothetical protein